MKYLNVQQVLKIHARSIELFGGDPAVRDLDLLESAVASAAQLRRKGSLHQSGRQGRRAGLLPGEEPSLRRRQHPLAEHESVFVRWLRGNWTATGF